MMAEAPGGELRGIGARLRAAREKRGLTVLQAAERLHLDAGIVQALEAENFTALGADVYVRGHLRRYAEAVGESPAQLQQLYADSPQVLRPDLTRIPRGQPEKSSTWLLLPAVLLVVGFATAGLLWWLLTLPGEKAHALPAAPTPAAAAADAAPGTEQPAFPAPTGSSAAPASASPAGTSTGTGPQARLDLSFSGASWVEIADVQGHRLLHGLIEAGSARTLTGSAPFLVVLGNAPAVTLRVNGQAVLPGTLVRRDGSAHLMIDAAGRVSAAAPRLAHGD
jgi:cytoskeleton protein RodZ